MLNYGQHPWKGEASRKETRVAVTDEFVASLKNTCEMAARALEDAACV
jgi:hypothetical protein